MPNYVYHYISFDKVLDEQLTKLEEIANTHNGLCGYYCPMPEDIRNTTSPTRIVSETEYKKIMKENEKIDRSQLFFYEPKPITKKMQSDLITKYGTDNWYDWAYEYWGTKWGCFDSELDGTTLTFTTAWSPMNNSIIKQFACDFPNFTWHWEEEQGYGGTQIYADGEITEEDSYDSIAFNSLGEYTDEEGINWSVQFTKGRPQSLSTDEIKRGYYRDYSFEVADYLGEELPSDIAKLLTNTIEN